MDPAIHTAANDNNNNNYATPPIHPKLSLRHILNSTADSQRCCTTADRRQQLAQPPPQSVSNEPTAVTAPLTGATAATLGSTAIRRLDSSALPRTNYHAPQQSQQHPSSNASQPFTRYRTRNRALSNLSNASLPTCTGTASCRQTRRPATRAAASGNAGDENKINPTVRSSKNAGLALRNRNSYISSSAASSQKGGKPDIPAASTAASRRRALADSSNKVPQHAAGGRGGKHGGADKDQRLIVVAEDAPPAADAGGRPALPRRRSTRTSLTNSKTGDDQEDAVMDIVDAEQSRPIRSMRTSASTAGNAGSSKPSSSRTTGVLAGKPTNIPRRSSTTTVTSTKNAGLKRSLKSSSVAPSVPTEAAEVSVEIKKSTKNAGLRLKREIQALESDGETGGHQSSGRKSSSTADDENESKSARAARQERRRSKRLRHNDPEGDENVAAAPSTSTSANFQSTASDLDLEQDNAKGGRSAAAAVRRVIDIPDDDDDEGDIHDDDENIYELAKDAGWEDLDIGDEEDPLMVTEYVVEIHEYMKELELQTRPDPHYMDRQSEVNWKMRSILVDWLIEVHGKFRLLPETIFLAVNIMDRLLSIRTVSLVKFQLVGIVSLQLASKYEEVVCPSVSSFLYMTDGCYTEEELLAAERYVLKQIDFNLSYPNPINFLRRISKADGYDIQTRTVAKYFIEMSCVERKFMNYTPSLIAAAGMWLARKILDRGHWNANLVHYSTYSQLELLPCAQLMLDYILRRSQAPGEPIEHPHFYKKYSAKKFYKAAEIVRQWAERRYLVRKPNAAAGGAYGAVTTLFTGLEGGGRLEEWEDEGEEVPEVDYE